VDALNRSRIKKKGNYDGTLCMSREKYLEQQRSSKITFFDDRGKAS
jgi:hypothetical protein